MSAFVPLDSPVMFKYQHLCSLYSCERLFEDVSRCLRERA